MFTDSDSTYSLEGIKRILNEAKRNLNLALNDAETDDEFNDILDQIDLIDDLLKQREDILRKNQNIFDNSGCDLCAMWNINYDEKKFVFNPQGHCSEHKKAYLDKNNEIVFEED